MNRRKKILIHSNYHNIFTGFGKNCKNILKYLYSTGKYELFELANGLINNNIVNNSPWKVFGGIPNDPSIIQKMNTDPHFGKMGSYGLFMVDEVINTVKPDVYIGIEDIWAFSETVKKPWWNKMNCMIWTTLDSLPILPEAINMAPKIKNYYCWSSFAEKAMHDAGFTHVKTLHGSIDEKNFFKLSDQEKLGLRNRFLINEDDYIIGYVFRNQLRKTVADLLTSFKFLKMKSPETNYKLLLHTNWSEGWDIPRLMQEMNISSSDVLTTYHCKKCKNFHVGVFQGQGLTCPFCKTQKTFFTVSVDNGVSEYQLNQIYNLMNLYVHPFTSGGQEIPLQEAKLTELVTLCTNYACGEEMCSKESGGFPLSWFPYREIGTQFIKASTNPIDISEKISGIVNLDKQKVSELGKMAREYIIKNYSFESIGKQLESIIDNMPDVSYELDGVGLKTNPEYKVKDRYASDVDFVIDLHQNMLGIPADVNSKEFAHWITKLRNGEPSNKVINDFVQIARKKIEQEKINNVEFYIDKDDPSPRIAFVIPSDSFVSLCCSYFIKSIKEKYPEYKLYVFAEKDFHSIFYPYIQYIHKICPKVNNCENQLYMEGYANHNGFFDICYVFNTNELSCSNYSHNDKA